MVKIIYISFQKNATSIFGKCLYNFIFMDQSKLEYGNRVLQSGRYNFGNSYFSFVSKYQYKR